MVKSGLNAKLCEQSTAQISTPHPSQYQYEPHQWTLPNYYATNKLATALYTLPQIT